MSRKNRLFAKLASTVNNNGKLQETSLAADIDVGGVEGYADTNALPPSPSLGDLALVTSTNTLYVYNGSAWFNIAIANQAPTAITGNEASYALASDGTPTIVTLTSTDPEGFPLTWSSSASGDTQVGTVTNTDNVFTITPSTDEADAGELSVTFSVTDGTNTENSTSTFTLAFAYTPQASQFSDGGLLANGNTWGANTSSLLGLKVSPDGSRMWLMHTGNQSPERAIFQLDLTTPYDVTTATNSTYKLGNFQGDFVWSTDGYILLTQEDTGYVAKRTCSTPYDITTMGEPTPPGDYINVGTSQRITGMQVSPDGLRLLAISQVSSNDRKIQEFTMSSPNNFSSLTLTSTGSRVLSTTGSTSMVYNNDGTKLYVAHDYYIDEYNVTGTPYGTSLSTRRGRFTANSSTFGTTGVGFFNSDGTKLIAYSKNRREVRLINTGS